MTVFLIESRVFLMFTLNFQPRGMPTFMDSFACAHRVLPGLIASQWCHFSWASVAPFQLLPLLHLPLCSQWKEQHLLETGVGPGSTGTLAPVRTQHPQLLKKYVNFFLNQINYYLSALKVRHLADSPWTQVKMLAGFHSFWSWKANPLPHLSLLFACVCVCVWGVFWVIPGSAQGLLSVQWVLKGHPQKCWGCVPVIQPGFHLAKHVPIAFSWPCAHSRVVVI